MGLKEKELEALKTFVKNLESEKEETEAENRKVVRDAEMAKHISTTSAAETTRQKELLDKKACEKCDEYKKKEEKYERLLKVCVCVCVLHVRRDMDVTLNNEWCCIILFVINRQARRVLATQVAAA